MIMQDQSRRLSEPLQWGRRERMVVAVLLGCVVLALAGLTAYGLSSGSSRRADCIDVTFASTLGGADLRGCGAQGRKICAEGHQFHSLQSELRVACRRAKFPFGS
jgi:hypothetical protein